MNFKDIKNMNKKEFEQFMFNVQSSNKKFCVRCGNFTLDRITISVAKDGKSPRKLCNICKECYTSMLDYLGISDIEEQEAYMEEQKELIKSIEKWLPFEIENLEEYVGGLYGKD